MSQLRLVECVPNFSEGQNREVIDAIAQAIAATEGCSLLDVDAGASTNRTVYTFVGSPEDVVEGALHGAKMARQLIDMARHKGEHPRLGALDVCPFIPVRGVTMDDCVECAKRFAERAALEIGIPVYLYGFASEQDYRKTVPQIRAGEYEGLANKIKIPEWKPDYGPAEFLSSWGATVTGARKFLIAYNVNILGTKEQAHRIALNVREQGRAPNQPGRLKCVQGMGWWLDEANIAQVSMNLGDLEVTPMHVAFEECVKDANELNVGVCGSQIVGVVPLQAMLMAAEFYIKKENLFIVSEDQKVRLAIERLGLSSIQPFDPKTRIIDYMVGDDEDGPLVSMSLKGFIHSLGSRSSAPGGGSAAAAIAAIGAALGTMVGWMSFGNKKFEALDSTMRRLIPELRQTMVDLVPMVDADTSAFSHFMESSVLACKLPPPGYIHAFDICNAREDAGKLPHKTAEEQEIRERAMQKGLQVAIEVPMNVIRTANRAWPTLTEMAKVGNISTKSDLQVGARALETGVWGAYYNVAINMLDIKDEDFKTKITQEAQAAVELAQEKCKEVLQIAADRK